MPATAFAARLLFLAALGLASAARAQPAAWPERPVKLVVPYPAGSLSDRIGRVLAQGLEQALHQPFVVENRAGAGATIGSDYVAKARPDGYTILLGANASHAVNPAFMKLGYDPVRSFEPVSLVAVVPSVLMVRPALPYRSVGELLAAARANPGGITYASAGIGTSGHIGMEMLASMGGVKFLHVPAKGPGQAILDVAGGQVDMLLETVALSAPLVKDGRLRGLAVTSEARSAALPELPTLAEAGVPKYELLLWFALYAPAGTPPQVVQKLQAEAARILGRPAVRDPLAADGVTLVASTPAKLAAFQQAETLKFAEIIRKLGLDLRN